LARRKERATSSSVFPTEGLWLGTCDVPVILYDVSFSVYMTISSDAIW
jgi:hypothetical protein